MNIKKIIKYLLFLLPWFLGALLFPSNPEYYQSLDLPFFAPPSYIFPIVWTILFLLVAYSFYLSYNNNTKKYYYYLYFNYLFNQLYTFFFFKLQNPLLGAIDCLITAITGILFYNEMKSKNKKASKFLIPYLAWIVFATILSFTILFRN